MRQQTPAEVPPLAITLREFYTRFYPCSRARAATMVRSGELPSFLDHGRRMILFEAAREYVQRKAAAGGAIDPAVSEAKSLAGKKGRESQLRGAQ